MTNKSFRTKRGIALISVLWISVLLSLVAASFTRTSRTEINLTRNLVENARAEAAADAAVNRAVLGLFNRPSQGGFRVDGTVYHWRFGESEILFRVEDEGGKVDINSASLEFLRKLFRAIELSPQVARELSAAILDFRDFDDDREQGGAEDRDYRQANLLQEAKDAPFELIEELQQVIGMTTRIYERLKPYVTVYSGQSTPYSPIAAPLIQEILKKDAGFARRDEDEASEDDEEQLIDDGEEGTAILLSEEDPQPLNEEGTDARSPVGIFTIHAEARTEGGGVFARKAVVRVAARRNRGMRIFAWTPAPLALFPEYDAALAELGLEEE